MPKLLKQNSYRTLAIMASDILLLTIAGGFALLVRFDFSLNTVPTMYVNRWLQYLPLQIGLMLVIFWLFRMYHFVWRNVARRMWRT